eukprot:TRINITY_DN26557_c1_g1_i1.p1 TRINITY_DN26557_c1_g1~~TRINITY_DN26557_c1_g1_i1.p1  ORF type:complete len:102 (+),score=3.70 TRINITY_DN26557_c1_g1_i1:1598-1903(+)
MDLTESGPRCSIARFPDLGQWIISPLQSRSKVNAHWIFCPFHSYGFVHAFYFYLCLHMNIFANMILCASCCYLQSKEHCVFNIQGLVIAYLSKSTVEFPLL